MAKVSEVLSKPVAAPDSSASIFEYLVRMKHESDALRRSRQVHDVLEALEDMKAVNSKNPTPKRSKMIEAQEERLRKSGILK